MTESLFQQAEAIAGRHPKLLDHRGYALEVTAGHVDVFAVSLAGGNVAGARHHLFRVESGEIILDLQGGFSGSGMQVQVLAVGSPGAEAQLVPRADIASFDPVATWIRQLGRLITGANPSWDMLEVAVDRAEAAVPPGKRRRGPARSIVWVSLESGTAKPMGLDPAIAADGPPLPLTSGMWIEAGQAGCSAVGREDVPERDMLWPAIDQFHLGVASCVQDYIARDADREAQRLVVRGDLMAAQTMESFDRLADVVVQREGHAGVATDPADPLLAACRMAAEAVRAP